MTSDMAQRTAANGAATVPAAMSAEYLAPPTRRSISAQVTAMLAIVTGLWVAISPWFLSLQSPMTQNSTVNNLVIGLAVAALGVFAIAGARGFLGLEMGSLLLGVWLIISPFILAAKFTINPPMYWSNIWSGGLVVVLALASLAGLRRARAS